MMPSKKTLHKNIYFSALLFLFVFSVMTFAKENTLDAKIDKILKASEQERALLIKQLKDDIAKEKYNRTESNQTSPKDASIDEKIKNRPFKYVKMAKCNMDKCDLRKCGMDRPPKKIKIDDNMSCGCE